MAVQVRCFTPSPPSAVKVIREVVCHTPRDTMVCPTSLVRLGTLHEKSGGCEAHVCVTEHETLTVEPASTSAGTWLMAGLSGEAEQVEVEAKVFSR